MVPGPISTLTTEASTSGAFLGGASRTRTGDLLGAIGPESIRPGQLRLAQVTRVLSGSLRFAQFGITSGSTYVVFTDNRVSTPCPHVSRVSFRSVEEAGSVMRSNPASVSQTPASSLVTL